MHLQYMGNVQKDRMAVVVSSAAQELQVAILIVDEEQNGSAIENMLAGKASLGAAECIVGDAYT